MIFLDQNINIREQRAMEREFAQLYDTYFGYVYTLVRSKLPLPEDQEDTISDVFVSLWEMRSHLDPKQNVKALIYLITQRRVNDKLRDKYRLHMQSLTEDQAVAHDSAEKPLPAREQLLSLVKQLNEKQQQLFTLKYEQNYSYAEIATAMGITINNAKVINNRLVKKLQKLWQKTKINQ